MRHKHFKSPRGVTLIELTIVIAILLVLITVLFISADYYKKSADKAACIVQISAIQKSLRSYQNLKQLSVGDPVQSSDFIGQGKPRSVNVFCPLGGGVYTLLATVPASGIAFATCNNYDGVTGVIDPRQAHNPASLTGW